MVGRSEAGSSSCPICGAELPGGQRPCPRCDSDPQRTWFVPSDLTPLPADPRSEAAAAAASLSLEPDERYEVLATLGRGGMGVVYKVHDRELDEVIALKVLDPIGEAPLAVERFKQEIKLARRINHPNVARLYDLVLWRRRLGISQEYIEGKSLSQLLQRGPLPVPEVRRFLRHLCSALAAAHRLGVVHRDLKPANVLVDAQGEPRIVDFGLAFLAGSERALPDARAYIMGTPFYMAPEQAFAPDAVDHRADIYSLGVVLYQMATGKVPFGGSIARDVMFAHLHQPPVPPSRLVPGLPPAIDEVTLRCLEKDPGRRWASAMEAHERLEYRLGREVQHRPGDTPPVAVQKGMRGKVLVIDDDEDVRAWLRAVLRAMGCVVVEAGDGYAGMEAALHERPGLVLLDIMMPKLDGRDTLRILKSNPATSEMPVVMVTGLSDEEEALLSKETGAAAFLNKPVQRDVLELVVERYLR